MGPDKISNLRLEERVDDTFAKLDECNDTMNKIYSEGAIEGFSEKPPSFTGSCWFLLLFLRCMVA